MTDIALNEEGIKQAKELRKKIDLSKIDICICSPLKRAKTFLDNIKREYPNKNILIISHGSFMKALHFNLKGYDENTNFLTFNPQNANIYEYEIE